MFKSGKKRGEILYKGSGRRGRWRASQLPAYRSQAKKQMRKPLFAGTDQLQVSANCFSSRLLHLAGAQLLLAMPSAPPVAAFV